MMSLTLFAYAQKGANLAVLVTPIVWSNRNKLYYITIQEKPLDRSCKRTPRAS